ncbi:MAG: hypothetical protein KAV42_08415 [Candidatus Krumholzibacteria bacterium]|nr:hypothetical protein [Candidatus Krumholzibacteria bacterium]
MERFFRWVARLWSIVSIAFIITMFIGERVDFSTWNGIAWIMFIFFPVGVLGGLIHGWRKEALGGSVAVFSLLAYYMVHFIETGILPQGPWFIVTAFPGVIYMGLWLFTHNERTS